MTRKKKKAPPRPPDTLGAADAAGAHGTTTAEPWTSSAAAPTRPLPETLPSVADGAPPTPSKPSAPPDPEHHERQQRELEALQSIYMDDFTLQSASPTAFEIRLVALKTELKEHVFCFLTVRFSRRYPSEAPALTVRKGRGLSDAQMSELERTVHTTVRELAGQEMVFDACTVAQDFITSHNSVIRGVRPMSAHEEMVARRAQTEREALEEARVQFQQLTALALERRRGAEAQLAAQVDAEAAALRDKLRAYLTSTAGISGTLLAQEDPVLASPVARDDGPEAPVAPVARRPAPTRPAARPAAGALISSAATGAALPAYAYGRGREAYAATGASSTAFVAHVAPWPVAGPDSATGEFAAAAKAGNERIRRIVGLGHARVVSVEDCAVIGRGKGRAPLCGLVVLETAHGSTLGTVLLRTGFLAPLVAREYARHVLEALAWLHARDLVHKNVSLATVVFGRAGSTGEAGVLLRGTFVAASGGVFAGTVAGETGWKPPEATHHHNANGTQLHSTSDVWSAASVLLEALCGCAGAAGFASPHQLLEAPVWQRAAPAVLTSFLQQALERDEMRRASAADLLAHPFFAAEQSAVFERLVPFAAVLAGASDVRVALSGPSAPQNPTRAAYSRYRADFEELEVVGRGGFGEVVKARNKLDGRVYAIKKVPLPGTVEGARKLLREAQLLSRLHHRFVVRYYQAWVEQGSSGVCLSSDGFSSGSSSDESSSASSVSQTSGTPESSAEASQTSGTPESSAAASNSADSNGPPTDPTEWFVQPKPLRSRSLLQIYDDDSAGSADGSESETSETKSHLLKDETNSASTSESEKEPQTLYIQMDYCEKKTLLDVIREGLEEDEAWRLLRQMLEGIAHIHAQGMIHRDLKPSNIFLDAEGNVKIGDLGLATLSADAATVAPTANRPTGDAGDGPSADWDAQMASRADSLTSAVGTPVYVAPEIATRRVAPGSGSAVMPASGTASATPVGAGPPQRYTTKVDMYSLGICVFEMFAPPFSTAMERFKTLNELRRSDVSLPAEFVARHEAPARIVRALLSHVPRERPGAAELLRSTLLPPRSEEEYLQEALRTLTDPANSIYYSKLLESCFERVQDAPRDFTFDDCGASGPSGEDTAGQPAPLDINQAVVLGRLQAALLRIFQKHGAVPLDAPLLVPKTALGAAVAPLRPSAELLDVSGTVAQLPHDLTLPFARYASRLELPRATGAAAAVLKRYTFGRVFRGQPAVGGQPRAVDACDFDICHTSAATSFAPEAEALQVVDELLGEFPGLRGAVSVGDVGGALSASSAWQCRIVVNHARLFDLLLDVCGVPPNPADAPDELGVVFGSGSGPGAGLVRPAKVESLGAAGNALHPRRALEQLLEQLFKSMSWTALRSEATGKAGLRGAVLDRLKPLAAISGDLASVEEQVLQVLAHGPSAAGATGSSSGLGMRALEPFEVDILRDAFAELQLLTQQLAAFRVSLPIVVMPLFTYNHAYYRGNIMFGVAAGTPRRLDLLAGGGRYDHLVARFAPPFRHQGAARVRAVGISIGVQKFVRALAAGQRKTRRAAAASLGAGAPSGPAAAQGAAVPQGQPGPGTPGPGDVAGPGGAAEGTLPGGSPLRRCDVFVAAFGRAPPSECTAIAAELWAAGISCDYLVADDPASVESAAAAAERALAELRQQTAVAAVEIAPRQPRQRLEQMLREHQQAPLRIREPAEHAPPPSRVMQTAKRDGFALLVIIKQKGDDHLLSYKVKNLATQAETEVPRGELVAMLASELSGHGPAAVAASPAVGPPLAAASTGASSRALLGP